MIYHYKKALAEVDLAAIYEAIETFGLQNHIAADKLFAIQLIIEELVSNTIKYGGSGQPDEIVEIKLRPENDRIFLTIMDSASEFNPLNAGEPDITLPAEERDVGGLGLFLVLKKVKALSYKYQEGFNIVRAEI